ncbi:sensor domain-containing diguanylate cyclase [Bacillus sp. T3]|uniref:sensor domain-containing diguanylate cyclase n=1 Tax=Bacillus sp. T3 TaxID=467262 RepID=UPI0029821341|nr:sensor domain-containing diguanylate cyclase [Bacillus sp. T3]
MNQFGEITYLNPAFERVLDFPSFDAIGANLESFFDNEDHLYWCNMIEEIIKNPIESIRNQVKLRHRDGSTRWCDVVFTNYLADPHINGIVFNIRDFTKQKEATDIVNQLANFDFLTGLPNRRHFENYLRDSLKSAKKDNSRLALLFVDLDGFKHINDTLGHEIGDLLLKGVGERITSFFEETAFVSRLGGDEFAVVIPNVNEYVYLQLLAENLVKAFNLPFIVAEYKLNVSASIGISIYPIAGEDMGTLLKKADVAMYRAKHNGKNHYQLYIPSMEQNTVNTLIE